MTRRSDDGLPPAERIDDIPRITEALRMAVREALWRHKLAGNPVAVWRNNQVVWIQPEDIPAVDRQDPRKSETL